MELLAAAADAEGYQGQKAGNRLVGGARNLMLAAATSVAAAALAEAETPERDARALLVRRSGTMLATAAAEVEAFAATLPDDLRQALRALVEEGRRSVPAQAAMP